jgi:hypothetical protein
MFRGIETRFLGENGFLSTNLFLNIYSHPPLAARNLTMIGCTLGCYRNEPIGVHQVKKSG